MYISIVKTENNRISKFAEFDSKEKAISHAGKYGGVTYDNSANTPNRDLWVEGETITVNPVVDLEPEETMTDIQELAQSLVDAGVITEDDLPEKAKKKKKK